MAKATPTPDQLLANAKADGYDRMEPLYQKITSGQPLTKEEATIVSMGQGYFNTYHPEISQILQGINPLQLMSPSQTLSDNLKAAASKSTLPPIAPKAPTGPTSPYAPTTGPTSPYGTQPATSQPGNRLPTQGTPPAPTYASPTPAIEPSLPGAPNKSTQLANAITPKPTTGTLPSLPLGAVAPNAKNPQGGLDVTGQPTATGQDINQILSEAGLQAGLGLQTAQLQDTQRQQQLSSLADLLAKQQQQSLTEKMPGIYEDLNTRGLLRSSALGEKVGLEAKNLSAETANALAQQALKDRETSTGALGNIEQNYLNARSSALQRGMSLEDFQNQLKASKELGAVVTPVAPTGNGKGAMTGAMGGTAAGAATGSLFGPAGTVPGAIIGGLTGLMGGKS